MTRGPKAERRQQAEYYATTHTTKGTLLSQAAEDELCAAYLELLAEHRALEQAHETNDQALDEALRQRDGLRREVERLKAAAAEPEWQEG